MALPTISGEFGVVNIDLKTAKNGNPWVKIRGVAKKEERDANGVKVDGEPTFIDIVSFIGAQHLYDSISKGDGVVVSGVLQQRRWTDRETGQSKEQFTIIADVLAVSTRNGTARTITKIQQDEQVEADTPAEQADLFGAEPQ